MVIQHLIWSRVVVKDANDKALETLSHVSANLVQDGSLLWLQQYTSSQGTSTDKKLSYSYPTLYSMSMSGITLKAFGWGKTAKDTPVTIELEF